METHWAVERGHFLQNFLVGCRDGFCQRYFLGKMVDFSSLLLLLAGLCFCKANVIDLTNDNFDSVCI